MGKSNMKIKHECGTTFMQMCVGCGEHTIGLFNKRVYLEVDYHDRKDIPVICEKCNNNKGMVPLNPSQHASNLALVRCRGCGDVAALLEKGKYKAQEKDGGIKEYLVESCKSYDGVCGKCLGLEENVAINLGELYKGVDQKSAETGETREQAVCNGQNEGSVSEDLAGSAGQQNKETDGGIDKGSENNGPSEPGPAAG